MIPFTHEEAADSTGFLLWQLTTIWQRAIRASLKPHDLTQVQFVLLASLAWFGRSKAPITQTALANHARLDVMMTSQVLRTLEGKGLVSRVAHPVDPRAKALRLTRAGTARIAKALPAVEQVDKQFFSATSVRPRQLNAIFNDLIRANTSQGEADVE